MRHALILSIGLLIGQWLAFSGVDSPAAVYRAAREAVARADWNEAARQWNYAVSRQPDNPYFNYMRAASLARLGHRHAAADALQMTLLLEPEEQLVNQIRKEMAGLAESSTDPLAGDSIVPLEGSRGVWIVPVVINGRHRGRFLFDTGSSVVVLSPAFAATVGAQTREGETLELETLGGRTRGTFANVSSLRVGASELKNAEVIVHAPGGDIDGILGNSFLNQWDVSFDPDRRLLRLRALVKTAEVPAATSPKLR
jgi:clan AA aspartic protease (TIGR02281 family)